MSYIKGIFGLQGSGKTWLTTYLGLQSKSYGVPLFSNYTLKNVEYKHIGTIEEAQNVRNGLILFDEFWEWVHSRTSTSKINKTMMSICLKNRKRGVSIIYNSQLNRMIDVILRDVTNFKYLPRIVEHMDNKKYVHYIVRDLMGDFSDWYTVPFPLEVVGKFFDTTEEPNKPNEIKTPLEVGIGKEKDFVKAIGKCKGVKFVELIPNSGNGSSWSFDVIVYANNGVYAVDVKGSSRTHVYLTEYGNKLLNKINNAYSHKAIPCIAFPKYDKVRLTLPKVWYLYILDNNSYLKRLKTMPYYNKLKRLSKNISNINFYKK